MKKVISTLLSAALVLSFCSVVLAAQGTGQISSKLVKQLILSEEEPAPAPQPGIETEPAPEPSPAPAPEPDPDPDPAPEPK